MVAIGMQNPLFYLANLELQNIATAKQSENQ